MRNRWVFRGDRKTAMEGVKVTCSGRLFQTRAAATGKTRSPTVDSRVQLTINDEDELERCRWRASRHLPPDKARRWGMKAQSRGDICTPGLHSGFAANGAGAGAWCSDVVELREGEDEPSDGVHHWLYDCDRRYNGLFRQQGWQNLPPTFKKLEDYCSARDARLQRRRNVFYVDLPCWLLSRFPSTNFFQLQFRYSSKVCQNKLIRDNKWADAIKKPTNGNRTGRRRGAVYIVLASVDASVTKLTVILRHVRLRVGGT